MKFETLKERMEYYKSLVDYKLTPNSYVLCHIDGRAFSKMIKNKYQLPFDDKFINMMNDTAAYICKNVQGCKLAYVQSDEISLIITDFDTPETDAFFSFRLCKLQSIIASLATAKFNQLALAQTVYEAQFSSIRTENYEYDIVKTYEPVQFDCKCWTVPTYNDAFAWLKYRQNDCIKNSKQQAAQTYLSYNELLRKKTDEQILLLKEKKDIDWYTDYDDGKKYGRLIYKEEVTFETTNPEASTVTRNVWKAHNATPFTRDDFDKLNLVPNKDIFREDDPETPTDKVNYLLNEKLVVGCEGSITKTLDGSTLMPFYYAILDDFRPIRFIFSSNYKPPREPVEGDRIRIVSYSKRDDGNLYFGELIE